MVTQAFLIMFNTWAADGEIFAMIMDGGIAYEMCRPVSIYRMWFSRAIGARIAEAILRCIPLLIFAFLLPNPYKLQLPASIASLPLFVITMALGICVSVSFCMLVYLIAFFTISPQGVRMVFTGAVDFLSGAVIPLPFIPQPVRGIMELLPFASMQNVPLRIYCGDLNGKSMVIAISLQIFWLVALILLGNLICKKAERRVEVQGG